MAKFRVTYDAAQAQPLQPPETAGPGYLGQWFIGASTNVRYAERVSGISFNTTPAFPGTAEIGSDGKYSLAETFSVGDQIVIHQLDQYGNTEFVQTETITAVVLTNAGTASERIQVSINNNNQVWLTEGSVRVWKVGDYYPFILGPNYFGRWRVNNSGSSLPPPNEDWLRVNIPAWNNTTVYEKDQLVQTGGVVYKALTSTPIPSGTSYTEIGRWNDTSANYRTAGDADWTNFSGGNWCANRNPLNNVADPFPLNTSNTYRLRYVQGGSATQASAEVIGTPTQGHIDTSPGGGIACYRFGPIAGMIAAFGQPVSNPNSPPSFNGGQWILEQQTGSGGGGVNPTPAIDSTRWVVVPSSAWSGSATYNKDDLVTQNSVHYQALQDIGTYSAFPIGELGINANKLRVNKQPIANWARSTAPFAGVQWSASDSYTKDQFTTFANELYKALRDVRPNSNNPNYDVQLSGRLDDTDFQLSVGPSATPPQDTTQWQQIPEWDDYSAVPQGGLRTYLNTLLFRARTSRANRRPANWLPPATYNGGGSSANPTRAFYDGSGILRLAASANSGTNFTAANLNGTVRLTREHNGVTQTIEGPAVSTTFQGRLQFYITSPASMQAIFGSSNVASGTWTIQRGPYQEYPNPLEQTPEWHQVMFPTWSATQAYPVVGTEVEFQGNIYISQAVIGDPPPIVYTEQARWNAGGFGSNGTMRYVGNGSFQIANPLSGSIPNNASVYRLSQVGGNSIEGQLTHVSGPTYRIGTVSEMQAVFGTANIDSGGQWVLELKTGGANTAPTGSLSGWAPVATPTWVATQAYNMGDIVRYQSNYFRTNVAVAAPEQGEGGNTSPVISAQNPVWDSVTTSPWSSTGSYAIGAIVHFGSPQRHYQALVNVNPVAPSAPTDYILVVQTSTGQTRTGTFTLTGTSGDYLDFDVPNTIGNAFFTGLANGTEVRIFVNSAGPYQWLNYQGARALAYTPVADVPMTAYQLEKGTSGGYEWKLRSAQVAGEHYLTWDSGNVGQTVDGRRPALDFDDLYAYYVLPRPWGLFGDATTLRVSNLVKLYTYDRTTKWRRPELEFNFHSIVNMNAAGFWADSTHGYVLDYTSKRVYTYLITNGNRDPAKDITLDTTHVSPYGIASDGTTMWIGQQAVTQTEGSVITNHNAKLFAYTLATGARDAAKDINILHGAGNRSPSDLHIQGNIIYVSDIVDSKIYAYNKTTLARDATRDFDTLSAAGNPRPSGIWSDGTTMFTVDLQLSSIFAYNFSTKARDPSKDINNKHFSDAGNANPRGQWQDGTTMWVADAFNGKIYAYKMSDQTHDREKDFNTLEAAQNLRPTGIYKEGNTMYVVNQGIILSDYVGRWNGAAFHASNPPGRYEIIGQAGTYRVALTSQDGMLVRSGNSPKRWFDNGDKVTLQVNSTSYKGTVSSATVSATQATVTITGVAANIAAGDTVDIWRSDMVSLGDIARGSLGGCKVYAYNHTTKAREPQNDINTLEQATNFKGNGIFINGGFVYILDELQNKVFAYAFSTGARDITRDINNLDIGTNGAPKGMATDGTTIWIVDRNPPLGRAIQNILITGDQTNVVTPPGTDPLTGGGQDDVAGPGGESLSERIANAIREQDQNRRSNGTLPTDGNPLAEDPEGTSPTAPRNFRDTFNPVGGVDVTQLNLVRSEPIPEDFEPTFLSEPDINAPDDSGFNRRGVTRHPDGQLPTDRAGRVNFQAAIDGIEIRNDYEFTRDTALALETDSAAAGNIGIDPNRSRSIFGSGVGTALRLGTNPSRAFDLAGFAAGKFFGELLGIGRQTGSLVPATSPAHTSSGTTTQNSDGSYTHTDSFGNETQIGPGFGGYNHPSGYDPPGDDDEDDDNGNDNGGGGGCFITTATSAVLGFENQIVLNKFRRIRDQLVPQNEVKEYYHIAPQIVKAIEGDWKEYKRIWDTWLKKAYESQDDNVSYMLYKAMVNSLKEKWNAK